MSHVDIKDSPLSLDEVVAKVTRPGAGGTNRSAHQTCSRQGSGRISL